MLMQPGTTITPGQNPDEPPTEAAPTATNMPAAEPNQAAQGPTAAPASQTVPQPAQPSPDLLEKPDPAQWQTDTPSNPEQDKVLVEWTASEYIDHQKTSRWYAMLMIGALLLGLLLFIVTRDLVSVVVVLLAAALFGVSGAKKPRTLPYRITNQGIQIADKLYPFGDIKHFSVVSEGGISSIQLLPLKRFMPALTIYYPPEIEETIFNALADFLPHEEERKDPVDRLMKRLRF